MDELERTAMNAEATDKLITTSRHISLEAVESLGVQEYIESLGLDYPAFKAAMTKLGGKYQRHIYSAGFLMGYEAAKTQSKKA